MCRIVDIYEFLGAWVVVTDGDCGGGFLDSVFGQLIDAGFSIGYLAMGVSPDIFTR